MPRPGTDILITEPSPGGGGELDTGACFMIGVTERGPVDAPALVTSASAFSQRFGASAGGPTASAAANAFFTERGANLSFLRLSGPTAKVAQVEVGALPVAASSPGTWANDVTVSIQADTSPLLPAVQVSKASRKVQALDDGDGNGNGNGNGNGAPAVPVRIVVTEDGQVVERSARITTQGDAVNWARSTSEYLAIPDVSDPTVPLVVTADTALAGGTDDGNITPDTVAAALTRFPYSMGFAQVCYPGMTDTSYHGPILDHCEANRRPALLDLSDVDAPTLAADADALHAYSGARFACALAPRILYPGPVNGTTMLVPYSAVQAGILARADATTGNPNEAAAGSNGESLAALGFAVDFDDDTREMLNDLGVTLPKMMRSGVMRTYGTRTVAGPDQPNWLWFPGSRTILAMAHEFDNAAEEFVHRQIDGQRRLFTRLEVSLGGICLDYFNMGALYGDTPEEAFSVDTASVNTTATIANGEVHAVVRVRVSPPGEWVQIEIQKTPLAQAV